MIADIVEFTGVGDSRPCAPQPASTTLEHTVWALRVAIKLMDDDTFERWCQYVEAPSQDTVLKR